MSERYKIVGEQAVPFDKLDRDEQRRQEAVHYEALKRWCGPEWEKTLQAAIIRNRINLLHNLL